MGKTVHIQRSRLNGLYLSSHTVYVAPESACTIVSLTTAVGNGQAMADQAVSKKQCYCVRIGLGCLNKLEEVFMDFKFIIHPPDAEAKLLPVA